MQTRKCAFCGYVDFASVPTCKNCGKSPADQGQPAKSASQGKPIIYQGGLSGGVNVIIIFLTACIVCTLTLFATKEFIPEGKYLIGCFLPYGFLGWIVGVIAANLANVVYKQIARPQS